MLKKIIILSFAVVSVLCVSGGTAQDKKGDDETTAEADLTLRMRRQHLDEYWESSAVWAFYGYRPHLKAHDSAFMNLPSYSAGNRYGYSYGTVEDLPTGGVEVLDKEGKTKIQMSQYGTWH